VAVPARHEILGRARPGTPAGPCCVRGAGMAVRESVLYEA
jgi:hypothetical protein